MSILSNSFDQLLSSYHAARGATIKVWIEGNTYDCIDSELTYDEVVMRGGIGERGGFRVDVAALSLDGVVLSKFMDVVSHPYVAARITFTNFGHPNGQFTVTARTPGDSGNEIAVEFVIEGNNTPLSLQVNGKDIQINLATDGSGNAVSTANEVIAAINADDQDLVTASLPAGSDGTDNSSITGLALQGGRPRCRRKM